MGYWSHRLRRNLVIALASIALTAVVFQCAGDKASPSFRWSLASGYASVALIGLALGLGPWWVHRGTRVPVSTDLRRDVGLWGAAFAMIHVVAGLQVHMNGDMVGYFLDRAPDSGWVRLRLDAFGVANWAGLVATAVLVMLSAISNDASLRAMGVVTWKKYQQWTYPGAVLVALHGAVYQVREKRAIPFVIAFALLIALVLALQLHGRRRRIAARRTASH